jgi:hypothetical protein
VFYPTVFALALAVLLLPGIGAGASAAPPPVRIDHDTLSIASLDSARRNAARATTMYLEHASVGTLIVGALDQLAREDASLSHPNWDLPARGNPPWRKKVDLFVAHVSAQDTPAYDVVSMKLCYIDEAADAAYYIARLDKLEAQRPDQTLVWWTMPLMATGSSARDTFNAAVRSHALSTGKTLFDIADIESHDASGAACADGGHEVLCPSWNDDGGHPNAAGSRRLAQGVWRLMDAIAQRRAGTLKLWTRG